MSWECRREGAYRYDRDVRKSGPICLVVTVHDNAQGRAPSPWDPLPCEEGSGCPRQAKVGAGLRAVSSP